MPNKVICCVVGLFAVMCALPLNSSATGNNRVVAVVNGSSLTSAELNQEISRILPAIRGYHGNVSEEKIGKIRSEAMQKLVESELQYQDALAKGMKFEEADLKVELDKYYSRFKSKDEFLRAITEAGFGEKEFYRFVARNVLSERIRAAEVDDRVKISDDQVKGHYDRNSARYSKPQEYRASQIQIKVDPASSADDRARARARADTILKKLKQGGDFADMAAMESDDASRIKGGDLGYFHAGQTETGFDEELAKLKVGETSDVFETIYGYHIVRLTEKREPRQLPFEEMRSRIKGELIANEKKRLMELWMSGLKAKAIITYSVEN